MKKVLSLILCSLMLLSAMPASADPIWDAIMNIPRNEAPDVYLNSEELSFDNDAFPQNVNGRVLVPFRAVLEAYDAEVLYDEETKEITATRGTVTVSFRNGDYEMTVTQNGVESTVTMDVCPTLNTEYNRTMVPIRFLSEAFGLSVGWTGEDVIVADFRGLLAQVVEENALLTAIREIRAENPEDFVVEQKGTREELYTYQGEVVQTKNMTFEGTKQLKDIGFAYTGEEEITSFDGAETKLSKKNIVEIEEDGVLRRWEGKTDQEKTLTETPVVYEDGESFLMDLAERTLLSAKTFDACMEDAILILENSHKTSDDYKILRSSLLAANCLFTADSVAVESGMLNFSLTPEEYRARRLSYYEGILSAESLASMEETLKNVMASYHLKGVFSETGELVVLDKEYARQVEVEELFAKILQKETSTRIEILSDCIEIIE